MSYELINPHRKSSLPKEITDYQYSRLSSSDKSKYRKNAGSVQDDIDRSHVGTSSDDTPIPYFQDKGYDTPSGDDSFSGFGGGSGGGAGAGGSWDDTGSVDSGIDSGTD